MNYLKSNWMPLLIGAAVGMFVLPKVIGKLG